MLHRLALVLLLAGCPASASRTEPSAAAADAPEPALPTVASMPEVDPFGWAPSPDELAVTDLVPQSTPVPGLTLRRVRHRDVVFHVATLELRQVDLRLAGQGEGWSHPRTFSTLAERLAAADERLVWGTNAGIFRKGGRPSGLYVEGGVVHQPVTRGSGAGNFFLLPNGAFLVGEDGARVRGTSEITSTDGVRMASQSGPLLVRDGRLHPELRPASTNRLRRSGVGVSDPHTVHFVMSEGSVRFHELATLFRDGLGAGDALYLDGVISQWVAPDRPPGPTDGGFSGMFFVAAPAE